MSIPRSAAARPSFRTACALTVAALIAAGCGTTGSPTPRASTPPSASGAGSASPIASASPSPTPLPTPYYTNPPDAELSALIPTELLGMKVTVPAPDQFAYTPGDIGAVFGDIGLRFRALQVAFVPRPHSLSLYAMRMTEPFVTTAQLEPYLATAAQYVGINGLHRDPWKLETIGGRVVWTRPEDDATAAGTMIYTWASGPYVFLMIGIDDALNQAMLAALPGEAAPTPTPRPSRSPAGSGPATPSASASPG
jgi:hypothetical protein